MYEAQYKYIAEHKEKYKEYARKHYHKLQADPERKEKHRLKREVWYTENRASLRLKQKFKKRERKLQAIGYLGSVCKSCKGAFHPAIYEFHHRNPEEKDRDPSKTLNLSWENVVTELDKCDLLCANCHRLVHHTWSSNE